MRFNNMIYFSRPRLEAFFPERPSRRLPTVNVELDLQVATVGLGPAAPRSPSDAELRKLRQVRHQIEREASHFYAPGLSAGEWIYFDLEMGWGTSYEDTTLPNLDDVLMFYGSLSCDRSRVGGPVDLMLCGSTEHLLKKTATVGRLGSGTDWLYELVVKINDLDARGDTRIPEELAKEALALPRVNQPDQVARWVFDVIAWHHSPRHRARVQGLARVDLNIPGCEGVSRLILATPMYVQYASRRSLRWITKLRLHRDLRRRYGRPIWKWKPDLPPEDRRRFYDPEGISSPSYDEE
ncbi:SAVMC3_10250 family protein [Streptosporangium sp. NPDC000563]|uniref:SAVMC3_10250 family protein n=1 Tax=Streptosporangium sp. NPDC000563 TaxID=3154366 RepID=UPI00331C6361